MDFLFLSSVQEGGLGIDTVRDLRYSRRRLPSPGKSPVVCKVHANNVRSRGEKRATGFYVRMQDACVSRPELTGHT